jgi:predicted metal-dependent phosphoesterase TrpH
MDLDALGFRPDAVETANARACFRTPEANRLAAEYAAAHALPEIGGSDAHSRAEVGNAYTVVDCADLSPETLREALRKGACSAVLVRPTSPLCKGLSQFKMARRAGNPRKLLRALLYLCYCLLLRIFSKR